MRYLSTTFIGAKEGKNRNNEIKKEGKSYCWGDCNEMGKEEGKSKSFSIKSTPVEDKKDVNVPKEKKMGRVQL